MYNTWSTKGVNLGVSAKKGHYLDDTGEVCLCIREFLPYRKFTKNGKWD
jgi:hypothetical protein